jgi:hypothetical protein
MAAIEVIYLVAATLWIGAVLAALCIGIRLVVKFRARRRRVNRLIDIVRIPVLVCTGQAQRRRPRRGARGQPIASPIARIIDSLFSVSRF